MKDSLTPHKCPASIGMVPRFARIGAPHRRNQCPTSSEYALSEEQVNEARERAKNNKREGNLIDADYRAVRQCPLLMIHVLTGKTGSSQKNVRLPTISMGFPPDDYITEVEVVANPVYIQPELFATHGMLDDDFDAGDD